MALRRTVVTLTLAAALASGSASAQAGWTRPVALGKAGEAINYFMPPAVGIDERGAGSVLFADGAGGLSESALTPIDLARPRPLPDVDVRREGTGQPQFELSPSGAATVIDERMRLRVRDPGATEFDDPQLSNVREVALAEDGTIAVAIDDGDVALRRPGGAFGPPMAVPGLRSREGIVDLAVNAAGDVVAALEQADGELRVSRLAAGASSFTRPQTLARSCAGVCSSFDHSVAVDAAGRGTVISVRRPSRRGAPADLRYARADRAQPFPALRRIDRREVDSPSIAAAGDTTVITWRREGSARQRAMVFSGEAPGRRIPAIPAAGYPQPPAELAVARDGTAALAWAQTAVHVAWLRPGADRFSDERVISPLLMAGRGADMPQAGLRPFPRVTDARLSIAPGGRALVAWLLDDRVVASAQLPGIADTSDAAETRPPGLRATRPAARPIVASGRIRTRVHCDEPCVIEAIGEIDGVTPTNPRDDKPPPAAARHVLDQPGSARIEARLSGRTLSALRAALLDGPTTARLTVTAYDRAGNERTRTLRTRLRR